MHVEQLPGVKIIDLKAFGDERGFFREIFRENNKHMMDAKNNFVQFNHSRSVKNVLRGLHYQRHNPQGKLVTVLRGKIWDVVADARMNSPTFGQWMSVEISDQNHKQLYVPPGYLHGFVTLSDEMDLLYACTDYYHAEDSFTVLWNDPTLNIEWPVNEPLVSNADKNGSLLSNLSAEQLPEMVI